MALAGFIVLAVTSILCALGVVFSRNALYCALYLVGVFAATAVLYLMLSAPFLAVIQIIVYAGAIMVLFVFVIMLLGIRYEESGESEGVPSGHRRKLAMILGGLFVVLMGALTLTMVQSGRFEQSSTDMGRVTDLALTLYKKFIFPFEVASILLLVAIIGAVAITRRHGRGLEGSVGLENDS